MLVDLSHTIEHGMITYAGLPPPAISDYLTREASRSRYAAGTEFHIGRIDMVANTGTYLDTPSHRFADGSDVSMVPLDAVAGIPALLLRTKGRSIDANAIAGHNVRGKALLIHTGWSQHWRTETYFNNQHPFVSRDAAEKLARSGVRLFLESPGGKRPRGPSQPAEGGSVRKEPHGRNHMERTTPQLR